MLVTHWSPSARHSSAASIAGAGDYGDYKSGIGVFMRGLLQAYQTPGSPVIPMVPSADFQVCLRGSVKWASGFEQVDLFDNLNVLATLTAAMSMLRT
jgi:hypothetical protein